jgi:hypothetical protein
MSLAKTFSQLDGSDFDLCIKFAFLHSTLDQLRTNLSIQSVLA